MCSSDLLPCALSFQEEGDFKVSFCVVPTKSEVVSFYCLLRFSVVNSLSFGQCPASVLPKCSIALLLHCQCLKSNNVQFGICSVLRMHMHRRTRDVNKELAAG